MGRGKLPTADKSADNAPHVLQRDSCCRHRHDLWTENNSLMQFKNISRSANTGNVLIPVLVPVRNSTGNSASKRNGILGSSELWNTGKSGRDVSSRVQTRWIQISSHPSHNVSWGQRGLPKKKNLVSVPVPVRTS